MVAVDINTQDPDLFLLAAFNEEQMRRNSLFPGMPSEQSFNTFLSVGIFDRTNRVGWLKIAPNQQLDLEVELDALKIPYAVRTASAALFLCCDGQVQKILKMHGDGFVVPEAAYTRMHPKLCFHKSLGSPSATFFLKE